MIEQTLADELRSVVLFRHLTDAQLDALCEGGHIASFPPGFVCVEGEPATCFYVLIDGEVAISKRSGDIDIETDRSAQRGTYFGAISASMSDAFRYETSARLTVRSRLFVLDTRFFTHFMQTHWPVAAHLLEGHSVGGRRQHQLLRHREMLMALGNITAGLTHQLNNPAAATARAVASLREGIGQMRSYLTMVADGRIPPATLNSLIEMQQDLARRVADTDLPLLSPLTVADREDRIADWLADHRVPNGWEYASSFVEAGLDVDWLERVADTIGEAESSLASAIGWLKHTIDTELRIAEIAEASSRISALLAGAKQYSQMDRGDYQSVDVHELLRSTVLMFGDRIAMPGKGKSITLVKELDRTLPQILCYPADLNQVWTNLIDNAIDAMDGHGTLTIRTMREGDSMIRVEICDDGPGVPASDVDHIFTPFYSTKPVGQGTGLGLDLAWRMVVDKHRGNISVLSDPGDTRLIVCLPLRAPAPEVLAPDSASE